MPMSKGLMSYVTIATICATLLTTQPLLANDAIAVGSSTALTGLSAILGQEMSLGAEVYFNKINAQDGITGKKIKFIILDDGYKPDRTAVNIRRLITQDHVLAIIGNVCSPTATVAVPIATALKTLLYGFFSGAEILRKSPRDKYVYNFRASYAEETSAMITGLLKAGFKPTDIVFFSQNDAFGDFGYSGAIKTLRATGSKITALPHVRIQRNTVNIEESLSDLLDLETRPKAIIILAPYSPTAKFIKMALTDMPNTIFLCSSFVGSNALIQELKGLGENRIIVTQVVPDYRSDLPAIREYREDLKKYAPHAQPGFVSLEGYLATKLFVVSLEQAANAKNLTREGIIDAFSNIKKVDIGIGVSISFDKNNHQALHQVWPTILKGGSFVPMDWQELQIRKNNN